MSAEEMQQAWSVGRCEQDGTLVVRIEESSPVGRCANGHAFSVGSDGVVEPRWRRFVWEPGDFTVIEVDDPRNSITHGDPAHPLVIAAMRRREAAARADRIKAVLVGHAIGDCLGAPVEGKSAAGMRVHGAVTDFEHPETAWTDDTQQALVLVESLVRLGQLDPDWIGRKYVELSHPRTGPLAGRLGLHRGIGSGFCAAVLAFEATRDWQASGTKDRAGNGAAMRIGPVAAALADRSDDELAGSVIDASLVTHRNARALTGALAVARLTAILLREPAFPVGSDRGRQLLGALIDWLEQRTDWLLLTYRDLVSDTERASQLVEVLRQVQLHWDEEPAELLGLIGAEATARRDDEKPTGPTDGFVLASVPTALLRVLDARSGFEDTVLGAVSLGGDADTVGAMVGGMTGAAVGLAGIPERLVRFAGYEELLAWAEALAGERTVVGLPDLREVEQRLCAIGRG